MCQLEELTNCRGPADLRQALARMPKGLNDTYAHMISRISDDNHDVAMRLLYWLLFSVRPLHIEELAELAVMNLDAEPLDELERFWEPEEVLGICPGLLTTVEEGDNGSGTEPKILVRLAHISIREYLLSDSILKGEVSRFHVDEPAAHASITECCLIYMRLIKNDLPGAVDDLPLTLYAAENWVYHYEMVPETATKIHHLVFDFFQNRKEIYSNWITYTSSLRPPRLNPDLVNAVLSPLEAASAYGLSETLKLMFGSEKIDTDSTVALQGALRAAYKGTSPPREDVRTRTVRLLLQYGANFTGDGKFASTLHAAGYYGFDEIVSKELDDGIDVNRQGGEFATALRAAIAGRYGCNFQKIMSTRYSSPGMVAKFDGIHIKAVQVLLERGADPNIRGERNGSALSESCSNGDFPGVKLLLNYGADPNFTQKNDKAPHISCLSAAAASGNIEMVQLLCDHGASVNCSMALNAAASRGHIDIVRFLLEKGANPNTADRLRDETLLQHACSGYQPETVKLLLEHGVNPNEGGGRFGSPLQCTCAAYGSVETLKILVSYGANVNQFCGAFGTALHAAAFYGDFEMVEYLISQGADIHAKGHMYPSVVRCALQNGHSSILCLLLKLGADMDTDGGRYGETLQKLLATAPADEPELWFRTFAKDDLLQLVAMTKKGNAWQDFDNIELDDRSANGVHVDDSKWACMLPPATMTPAG